LSVTRESSKARNRYRKEVGFKLVLFQGQQEWIVRQASSYANHQVLWSDLPRVS
jgi:hypothetical protein